MSEYCRQWASQRQQTPSPDSQTPSHDLKVTAHSSQSVEPGADQSSMTAHKAPPSPAAGPAPDTNPLRTSSPAPSDEEHDDDGLSLASSDLEHSWLNIDASEGGTSVSGSTSALGSATVSDLDPSSDSEHDWESDVESEGQTLRHIPHVDNVEDDSASEADETPSPFDTFQRSFIFPDPHSNTSSFTASTIMNTTPQRSFVDVTDQDVRSIFDLDGRKAQRVTVETAQEKPTAGPSTVTEAAKSFPAGPPPARQKSLYVTRLSLQLTYRTAFISVFVLSLLFLKLGPGASSFDLSGLVSNWTSPPIPNSSVPDTTLASASPPSRWLGAELQVVCEALSALSLDSGGKTLSPTQARTPIPEATSTAYRWFSSEYRWSREDESVPETVDSSQHTSLTEANAFHTSVQLLSTYLAWSIQHLTALMAFTVDALRDEIEYDIKQVRAVIEVLSKPDTVRAVVDNAAAVVSYSKEYAQTAALSIYNVVCANDRCSPAVVRQAAADSLAEAQRRSHGTLKKARRGLDNAIRSAHDAVDKAASEAHARVKRRDAKRDIKRSCYPCNYDKLARKKEKREKKERRNAHKCKRKRQSETDGESLRARPKCGLSGLMRGCGHGADVSVSSLTKGINQLARLVS